MELVEPVCSLVPCLWPSLARQISYFRNVKEKFRKLEKDVEHICSIREDINRERNKDITSKTCSNECQRWMEEVERIVTEVDAIKVEVDENRRCLNGCCFPDIYARLKLGKRIATTSNIVAEHKGASVFKGPMFVDTLQTAVEIVPLPFIIVGQTSLDRSVQHIMRALRNAKTQKIGLWGTSGVGKTTAMKSLNNLPEIAQTFQVVIWVTVSKDFSVRKVQNKIAERLQISLLDNESDESVARRIFQKLKSMKYLLLLDDVWSSINLEDIGIPLQNGEIGSKIVLTTQSRDVCRKMETDEEIKVEGLSKEEAWDLFREKVGEVVDLPSIEPIAREVVNKCDGLPLAIEETGKKLRKVEDVHVWQDALNQLGLGDWQMHHGL